jgi:hypothetical protein
MIIPFRDERGRRNGFLAGEAVYNLNGRRIGRLVAEHVFDPKDNVVAEVHGDILTFTKPTPWSIRATDALRSALRHMGVKPLHEVPD